MTAELLLSALPACDVSAARLAELHEAVNRLTRAELLPEEPCAGLSVDAALAGQRAALHDDVGQLALADVSREVTSLRLPGMPYALWVTGGLSWGDPPTDLYDAFARLAGCPALLRLLEAWARQDAAAADRSP